MAITSGQKKIGGGGGYYIHITYTMIESTTNILLPSCYANILQNEIVNYVTDKHFTDGVVYLLSWLNCPCHKNILMKSL